LGKLLCADGPTGGSQNADRYRNWERRQNKLLGAGKAVSDLSGTFQVSTVQVGGAFPGILAFQKKDAHAADRTSDNSEQSMLERSNLNI
jgi:hypothetical protein